MAANMVMCPRCGELHEAREILGMIEVLSCPMQPRNEVLMIGDSDSERGVAVIRLGEPVGERL